MGHNSTQTTGGHIIAARFGTTTEAEAAAKSMHGFIAPKDICIFHNNAPGQHGTTMYGDNAAEHQHAANTATNNANAAKPLQPPHPKLQSDATEEVAQQVGHAEGSAMAVAAAAGVAAGALAVAAGPVVALAAVGVAAYTGSLAGALEGGSVDDDGKSPANHAPAMRQGGTMIAVHVINAADEARVIQVLKAAAGADIEHAEGTWLDGDWVDFDPLSAPRLVAV